MQSLLKTCVEHGTLRFRPISASVCCRCSSITTQECFISHPYMPPYMHCIEAWPACTWAYEALHCPPHHVQIVSLRVRCASSTICTWVTAALGWHAMSVAAPCLDLVLVTVGKVRGNNCSDARHVSVAVMCWGAAATYSTTCRTDTTAQKWRAPCTDAWMKICLNICHLCCCRQLQCSWELSCNKMDACLYFLILCTVTASMKVVLPTSGIMEFVLLQELPHADNHHN